MCRLLKISGNSLYPVYQEGDFVMISKISLFFKPVKRGDILVFRHAYYGTLIKQADHVLPGGKEVFVLGTGEQSIDSRSFGPVKIRDLDGRVIHHIKKPGT
ncbi:MAG: S26 family signal peptidase [Chloroflexi bacterium]|nr:MAG: S26 family signal peptidase [Chloroflexota bacterium]